MSTLRQDAVRETKSKKLKVDKLKDLKRLKHYYEILQREIVNTDYLIRTLEKIVSDDIAVTSWDKYCRDNFGINSDRFYKLLNNGVVLNEEEIKNITLFVNR